MRRTWEIGTHTFPIVWVLFSRLILILWYTSLHWKCVGFPIKCRIAQKNPTKPIEWGAPGKLVLILFPQHDCFLSCQIPILWYSSLHGKYIGFLINFQQDGKIQQKPSNGQNLGNQLPYIFHSMGAFSIRSHLVIYFIIWEMHGFPHQFPIAL